MELYPFMKYQITNVIQSKCNLYTYITFEYMYISYFHSFCLLTQYLTWPRCGRRRKIRERRREARRIFSPSTAKRLGPTTTQEIRIQHRKKCIKIKKRLFIAGTFSIKLYQIIKKANSKRCAQLFVTFKWTFNHPFNCKNKIYACIQV